MSFKFFAAPMAYKHALLLTNKDQVTEKKQERKSFRNRFLNSILVPRPRMQSDVPIMPAQDWPCAVMEKDIDRSLPER